MIKIDENHTRSADDNTLRARICSGQTLATVVFNLGLLVAPLTASAAAVPCEDMLAKIRAAKTGVTLSAADQARLDSLEAKGIELCNADDDQRADAIFKQAMEILGK